MTHTIDVTFRNVDEDALRNFKAEAVRENKTFGKALVEAILLWLGQRKIAKKKKVRADRT